MKKDKTFKYGAYIIDLIALIVLLIFLSIEKFTKLFSDFETYFPSDLIVTLLPGIITIVSISLSLKNEKKYGLTTSEINGLRSGWFFNFLHMVIVMSIFIVIYTILTILGTEVSILVLDILAFFYSVYFSVQEIPLLIGSKKYFALIIRRSYLSNKSNLLFNDQSLILKAFQGLVLTEDIKQAYTLLSFKNKKRVNENRAFINELLDGQNRFFFASLDEVEIIKSNLSNEYEGLLIVNTIQKGYNNVKILLTGDNWYTLEEITGSKNETYQLMRTTYALHELTNSLSLKSLEKKELNSIIENLCFSNQNQPAFHELQKYVFSMCISTLNYGEFWFVESLLNNDLSPHYFFSLDNSSLGLFLSIYLAHITSKNTQYLNDNKITTLNSFMNKQSMSLNSDGSTWISLLRWEISYGNPVKFLLSLSELLKLYDSVDEAAFYPVKTKCVMYDASHNFSKKDVIDAWLQIVLFSYVNISDVDNKFIEDNISNLCEKDKKILFSVLSHKYIQNNTLRDNIQTDFLNIFGIGVESKSIGWRNSNIWKCLLNARNKATKEKIDNAIEKSQCDYQKIVMTKLISTFEKVKKENLFISNITLENSTLKYFSYQLDMIGLEKITEACMNRVPDMFDNMIFNAIRHRKTPVIYDANDANLIYDTIKNFNPDSRMEFSMSYHHLNNDQQKELSHIKSVIGIMMPCDLYWKEGAIKFNFDLDKEETIIRKLKDDEVEKIISDSYQESSTGLYYYSLYENDIENGIWITRNELRRKIKERIVLIVVVFKVNIEIDENRCLLFKYNKGAIS